MPAVDKGVWCKEKKERRKEGRTGAKTTTIWGAWAGTGRPAASSGRSSLLDSMEPAAGEGFSRCSCEVALGGKKPGPIPQPSATWDSGSPRVAHAWDIGTRGGREG